jgi:NAD(P)-dependent dehydrogenase (short-subunit alcohol dehydrogenase family)
MRPTTHAPARSPPEDKISEETPMTHMRLKDKNAIVTGASHGIGRAIALAFAGEGANLFVTFKSDEAAARDLVRELEHRGSQAHAERIDCTSVQSAGALVDAAERFLGRIDVLVNNVGVTTRTPFMDVTMDEYNYVLDVNLKFPFFLSQRVARHMVAHEIRGSIINVSSISAYKAISKMAHYQCSKAGLSMLTKSIAYELAPLGIRANTLSPGLTATNGNRNQWHDDPELWRERGKDIPLGRAGLPTDHAAAAILLASDEASWLTGCDLVIDGGESAI